MAEPQQRELATYPRQLIFYFVVISVASVIGSKFTLLNNNWGEPTGWFGGAANPLPGIFIAAFSLGPAMAIAARARVSHTAAGLVAAVGAAAALAMWWLFAMNDSSTSSLIFGWGWLGGIPASFMFTEAVSIRRENADWARVGLYLPAAFVAFIIHPILGPVVIAMAIAAMYLLFNR